MNIPDHFYRILTETRTRVFTKIVNDVGNQVFPDRDSENQEWRNSRKYLLPRSFKYVFSIRPNKMTRAERLGWLGFIDNEPVNKVKWGSRIHDGQRAIIQYETFRLYEILLEFGDRVQRYEFCYFSKRAIKDKNGKFWLVNQFSQPWGYDDNNNICAYVSTCLITESYEGEPYYSRFYGSNNTPDDGLIDILNKELRSIKNELLIYLFGLNEDQESILVLSAEGLSALEIKEILNCSIQKVNKVRADIKKMAIEIFDLDESKFRDIYAVATYFKKMDFI